ncbi:MAG: M23 family metallopeptidase [Bacteroidales bacterium]|nr:M23 family metallopeptidase [Bacteroidales bacterium]MDD4670650.1 M23 family metallopeptidase [Bacteroidales bacterium]
MKHTILLTASLFLTINIFAQNPITEIIPEESTAPPMVIDTVNTSDKFTKILIYDNHTWEYFDLGRPVIDTADFYEYWSTDIIHAYKGVPLSELPDEIDLRLVDSTNSFCPPITGRVRSGYKFRRTREHKGLDIPLNMGDTIRAAFDGVVRVAEFSRNTGGYGNLVVIRHPNGLETYYGHLSKYIVDTSEIVKAGEIIGYGGNTGRSTGPHLHFETRYMGQPFDPERLIDFETGTLRDTIVTLQKHYFSIYSHYGQTDEESKAASDRIVHTIRSGDTLGSLAVKYGTTVSNICKLNGIKSTKLLRIGQRLIVR